MIAIMTRAFQLDKSEPITLRLVVDNFEPIVEFEVGEISFYMKSPDLLTLAKQLVALLEDKELLAE